MRGYTMIELIVVMAVMAILAAATLPRLADRNSLQERGFRDQLRGMLMHARKTAMTQSRDVCVLIAPAQASAVYVAGAACNPAQPVAEPSSTTPYVLPVPNSVVMGGAALLRFNARGQPVPNANAVVTVGVLNLTINRETGLVQ